MLKKMKGSSRRNRVPDVDFLECYIFLNKHSLAAHREGKRVAISLWYRVDELLSLAVRVSCGERWIHR